MQSVIEYLVGIGEALAGILEFIVGIPADMLRIGNMLSYFGANIHRYFSWLPSEFLTLTLTVFTVAVFMRVFGKD